MLGFSWTKRLLYEEAKVFHMTSNKIKKVIPFPFTLEERVLCFEVEEGVFDHFKGIYRKVDV